MITSLWETDFVVYVVPTTGYYEIYGTTYRLEADKTYTLKELRKLKQEQENEKKIKILLGVK